MDPSPITVSMEKWLQRIEDKQVKLDETVSVGLQSIRNQIEAMEKSLPDRFLTRREWDVVLEAGKINREAQDALLKANDERHQTDMSNLETRLRAQESHGWQIAAAFGVAFLSLVSNFVIHFITAPK